MVPTMTDLTAIALQIGEFLLEIGPFILFGAVAAAAQATIFGRKPGPWTGERLIAPIAAIPLGLIYMLVAALRSALLFQTGKPTNSESTSGSGTLQRAVGYLDGIIVPILISAGIGAVAVVLTPTEPLWSLLSPSNPWRFLIAPLVAGIVKPRGGAELPLVLAMIIKGLDPAGAIAGIAGAGYLHARTVPLGILHVAIGAALGFAFSAMNLI